MPSDLVLMIFSAIVIVAGAIIWLKGGYLLENGKRARATIVDSVYESSSDGPGVHYPVVRFLTNKQEWITQKTNVGYSLARKVGARVEVIYDPDEPTNVEINSVFILAILPRLLVCAGVVGFVLSILFYLNIVDRALFL
jgi:hypothetical protein